MSVKHTDVAAYSLGLLDQKDREDFEAHLADCPECLAELGEFSALADLFAGLGPVRIDDEDSGESVVVDFVARRAAAQRKQTRQRAWLAAAASIVLLAGGAAAGLGLAPHRAPAVAALHLTGQEHAATDPVSGVKGVVGLVSQRWGTQVTLELSRLPVTKPLKCQLIAVSKTGLRRVMVGWLVPAPGYGVRGHPAPLLLVGGTWFLKKDLSEIQIQVFGGPTLLTIPI